MRSTSVPADRIPLGRMVTAPFRTADHVPVSEFSRSRNGAMRGTNTSNLTPAGARACWCSFSSNGRQMPWAGWETRGCVSGWPDGPGVGLQRRGIRWGDGPCGSAGLCIPSATITQKPLLGPARGAVVLEEEGHLR